MDANPSTVPGASRRFAVMVVALVLAAVSAAVIVAEPVDAQPPTLRQTIHESIKRSRLIPYSSNTMTDTWDVISLADEDPAMPGNVLTIYGNASRKATSSGNNDTGWQREHLWPRSYGIDDDSACGFAHNDVLHLFASEPQLNQSRSNHPFDDCPDRDCAKKQLLDGTNRANWMKGGDLGKWEVWANVRGLVYNDDVGSVVGTGGRRGDVARALLYMDVRYEGGKHPGTDCDEPDLVLTDDRSLIVTKPATATVAFMGVLSTLLRWHAQDPVDGLERHRNGVIEKYQGNRNPFIDDPALVCQVWNCGPAQPTATITGTVTITTTVTVTPIKSTPPALTITPTLGDTPTPTDTVEPTRVSIYLPYVARNQLLVLPTVTPTPTTTPVPTVTPVPPSTPQATEWPKTPVPAPTVTPTAPGPATLRISTLQCDRRDEFVRVVNNGGSSVNLSGWQIFSVVGSQTFTFPSYTLAPGATVTVHSGPDAPPTGGSDIRWTTAFIWNNTDGDEAQLKNSAGTVVDNRDC